MISIRPVSIRTDDVSGHCYEVHLPVGTDTWRWELNNPDYVERVDSCQGDMTLQDGDWRADEQATARRRRPSPDAGISEFWRRACLRHPLIRWRTNFFQSLSASF